jgi:hypothetical protein
VAVIVNAVELTARLLLFAVTLIGPEGVPGMINIVAELLVFPRMI